DGLITGSLEPIANGLISTAWLPLLACQVQPPAPANNSRSAATANGRSMGLLLLKKREAKYRLREAVSTGIFSLAASQYPSHFSPLPRASGGGGQPLARRSPARYDPATPSKEAIPLGELEMHRPPLAPLSLALLLALVNPAFGLVFHRTHEEVGPARAAGTPTSGPESAFRYSPLRCYWRESGWHGFGAMHDEVVTAFR